MAAGFAGRRFKPRSMGLLGMKERAALLGGEFKIAPGPGGKGTQATVSIPLRRLSPENMKILLTDDHAVVRHGLKQILADEFKKATFGESAQRPGGVEQDLEGALGRRGAGHHDARPQRPGGVARNQAHQPKLPVLVLSMHPEGQFAVRVLKRGASAI